MMYGMAPDDLGLRIRRARERRRWTQRQLAEALPPDPQGRRPGVRSVGRWERGEAVPRNAIGALESTLGVDLDSEEGGEVFTDPHEADLWALTKYSEGERREFIRAYREKQQRRRAG